MGLREFGLWLCKCNIKIWGIGGGRPAFEAWFYPLLAGADPSLLLPLLSSCVQGRWGSDSIAVPVMTLCAMESCT